MTVQHVLQPGYDYGKEFDTGLEVVLDGVAELLIERWEEPPGPGSSSSTPVWRRRGARDGLLVTQRSPGSPVGCRGRLQRLEAVTVQNK